MGKSLIDAALNGQEGFAGKAYFFKGKQYARYDWKKPDADDGYPKPLSAWGLGPPFEEGIDAAIDGRGKHAGYAYFFKGSEFIAFNWKTDKVEGTAKKISEWGFPAAFHSGIDAALNGGGTYEKYGYFFKGDQYLAYHWDDKTSEIVKDAKGRNAKLKEGWKLPAGFDKVLDAALAGQEAFKGKAFFFVGDQYARYDWTAGTCDKDYAPAHIRLWNLPYEFLHGKEPMTVAWIEYQHHGDGVMLVSGLGARGWKNLFEHLLVDPKDANKRLVKNMPAPDIDAKVVRLSWSGSRSYLCMPTKSDSEKYLGQWVLNPGVLSSGELTYGKAWAQADLVCVSGHGAGGSVWGDGSGSSVSFDVADETAKNASMVTTGRVKYLIISSCNNVSDFNAKRWQKIMHKANPIHGILGYEDSYAGDGIGATVMQNFAALLQIKGKTIVNAWKEANAAQGQPWAALVHVVSEKNTLADWIAGKLPTPLSNGDLKRFGKSDPTGTVLSLGAKAFTASFKMADGTVIDSSNVSRAGVGLIPGEKGALVVTKASGSFSVGDKLTLLFYLYRPTHAMDLDGLLELDPGLLAKSLSASAAVKVEKLAGANPSASNGSKIDGLRLEILKAGSSVELPYTVNKAAHKTFKNDGPAGSWGFFWVGLYPPGTSPSAARTGEIEQGASGARLW